MRKELVTHGAGQGHALSPRASQEHEGSAGMRGGVAGDWSLRCGSPGRSRLRIG